MPGSVTQALRQIVKNPYVNLVVGLVFAFSGLAETLRELATGDEFHLGVHHGAIVFGLLHALRSLSDVFEGLEYLDNSADDRAARSADT
ncbi:MAG: hypothetical protein QGI10_17310 [Vicinamibacterales bacterium]|jgi:hypothetical protein|nr:hypothetical protein [Vicinamibacterales bacterium]HJN44880.1 hypothetical protein [Vicinamibacterales bacterium]|tara:strand:+ start:440 stop:706 length:267 start_codon:yes stop_codon:yes gene_type:complete